MKKGGYVYIMSSPDRTALYTGVTASLHSRVWDHRHKRDPRSFTARYNCVVLVYYCDYAAITDAIAEEKRIKGGSRRQKEQLISSINPEWTDLWTNVQDWF